MTFKKPLQRTPELPEGFQIHTQYKCPVCGNNIPLVIVINQLHCEIYTPILDKTGGFKPPKLT